MTTFSGQVYRLLLRLYPASHRHAYGGLMAQAFHDQCRAAGQYGRWGWLALWWRTLTDVARTAAAEHLAERKVRFMDSVLFKNHPGRVASLLFLLPGIILSLYYFITIHNGEGTGYMYAGLAGVVGFALGWLKIIPQARPWGHFTLGFVIGLAGGVFFFIGMTRVTLGIPALEKSPGLEIRQWVTIAVSLLIIWGMGRLVDAPLRRRYWMGAGVLLAVGVVWAPLSYTLSAYDSWSLSWAWIYSAAILSLVALSVRLARRSGIQALLTVIVGLGMIQSINLSMGDVGEGKTTFGQLMLLLAYLFPLVICPAWLLLAPTWKAKKRGTLLSWGVMLFGMVILPVLDVFFESQFYFRGRIIGSVKYMFIYGPLLIGLWLAFTLYEKQHGQPETAAPDAPPLPPASTTA